METQTYNPPATWPAPVFNISCGSGTADSGALPQLSLATDKYLAQGVEPFLSIPLWAWIGLAGGALWYFWGRKHWREWGIS